MSWASIVSEIEVLKTEFNKSYKCINKHSTPTTATLNKHIEILSNNYNSIRKILNECYNNLTKDHQQEALHIFTNLRDRLVKVFSRHKLHVHVPISLSEELDITSEDFSCSESESETEIVEESEEKVDVNMAISALEFLNFAARIVPDFDLYKDDLQRFIDGIRLAQTQSTGHENTFIEFIKTKLVGTTRSAITTENTVDAIILALKNKIKYESTDVIAAKIMNVKQLNKPANQFSKEIEDLTKSLENAYIKDGVSPSLADKYATQTAVKAFTTNSSNDKVKLVMQSGNFSDMNEVVSKFVSTSTEFSQNNNMFFYNSNKRFNRNFNYRNNSYRNFNRGRSNSNQNRFNPPQNRFNGNANRGRGNHNRGSFNQNGYRQPNNYQNHNVRHFAEAQQENFQAPRAFSLGDAQQH